MRLINIEYDSNGEPFSVTCEEDGAVYVFEIARHGKWIESKTEKLYFGYGMKGYYDYPELCSVCHYDATENGYGVGNYCPNCGAKMDKGATND